ncbi:hypothetical protein JTE90_009027 [Oedothorax gibbosus]|uniref:Transmembrane inner ear expressed protein n=1 Tax=Oedothorax gibbosus TaxID=931172 RepID=A0AAV6VK40_9ARAC|nr:hypothetical protein JTE90_009027 [Oedothorax gibbosus]
MRGERLRFLVLLFLLAPCALHAHVCPVSDVVEKAEAKGDWLEKEVIAGFRIWQILFLVVAGLATLVIVCCCMTRCRIPRTRQEIEANHRRNQITQLFRQHLDDMVVDEVDLLWALDEVKTAANKPTYVPKPRPTLVERMKALLPFKRGRNNDEEEESDKLHPKESHASLDMTDCEDSPAHKLEN